MSDDVQAMARLLLRRVRKAAEALERAKQARDDAIREALANEGVSQVAVAREAGLHRSRVQQIVRGE